MKKFYLTLAAVAALTFASKAQTEQGKFIVGGQVGFETSKTKKLDIKNNSFSINPTVGYFVSDNWAVGTGVGYSWSKTEEGPREVKVDAFEVAPFARNYMGSGQFRFFSQLTVPMAWGKVSGGDHKSKFESYGVQLAPGFAFFPSSNIGVELKVKGLYFESSKDKSAGVTTNTFGLDANSLAPTLGVQFHF